MRLSQIRTLLDQKAGQTKLDAAEVVTTARALEQMRARTYDIKYPQLRLREFIDVDNTVDPGAQHVTYAQFSQVGLAVIISAYSTRLPRADVFRVEFSSFIRSIGVSYGISIQEMRTSTYSGVPLDSRKASAARRAFEEKMDDIGRNGDAKHKLIGFNNIPNASVYVVPNGAAVSTVWASKTPDEIIKDVNGILRSIPVSTKEIERPNMLLMPVDQYEYIATTPRSSVSDTTILTFLKAAHPEITFEKWWALKQAGAAGSDRMIAYTKDADHLVFIVPLEFRQLAPEWEGMELLTNCEGRVGGVQCFYPLSVAYGDGI